jgi:rare lipoprotein A
MRRGLAAKASITALFMLAMLSSSFGMAAELSSAGTETGTAACYSRWLREHRTSSGQRYNPNALTAAHATIPFGTLVKLTNIENGRSVAVVVNDRLSAHSGEGIILDISQRACMALKFPRSGKARVRLEVIRSNSSANSR